MQKKTNYGQTAPRLPFCAPMPGMRENNSRLESIPILNKNHNEFNSHSTSTIDIVEFLYPSGSGKRFPLTRCLLSSVIECLYVTHDKDEHNFKTVLDILYKLLCDINEPNNTREEKLQVLTKLFNADGKTKYEGAENVSDPSLLLDEWAWMSFEMFYNYRKMDSIQYTVACLIYDLIPFINVTFDEMANAYKMRHALSSFLAVQIKNAAYRDDKIMCAIYKARKLADMYFTPSDTGKKAILQIALFIASDETSGTYDLNADIWRVKNILMGIFKCGAPAYVDRAIFTMNNIFSQILNYYKEISLTTASLSDMTMMTLERILMVEGNILDLFPSAPSQKPPVNRHNRVKRDDDDEFNFFY